MISCVAIDDEPLALQQMVSYIEKTPFLKLQGQFESALAVMEYLQHQKVDLMFLDINMPDLSGMDFVKTLKDPPGIIFTTAYSEYAVEGFKVNAIDYLLKPISYEDFLKAAQKANTRLSTGQNSREEISSKEEFLFIKSEYKLIRLRTSEIKYIEGMKEYVRIHLLNQKPVMSLISMKKMEEHLSNQNFMRVHRSYIVNLDQVTTVERSRIVFDGKTYIPISDQYKEQFQSYIDKNFLN